MNFNNLMSLLILYPNTVLHTLFVRELIDQLHFFFLFVIMQGGFSLHLQMSWWIVFTDTGY